MGDEGEQARALAKDIVQQWFSRSLGTMHGWEKWKPIWEEQLTEQFTKEFRQVERETWEKARDLAHNESAAAHLPEDRWDMGYKCACVNVGNACEQQAKERA